jgi:hypothetical protein
LRASENGVVRKTCETNRDEVNGDWRILHNEEFCDIHSLSNIIQGIKSSRMRWVGYVARMGHRRCAYNVLVGKPEGKRALERSMCRREDNIKIDPKETCWGIWTGFVWLRMGTNGWLFCAQE